MKSVQSRPLVVAILLVVALLSGGAKTCGTVVDEKGPGEPCTRDTECRAGLTCVAGECAERDAGVRDASVGDSGSADIDAGAGDSGADARVPTDGGIDAGA